MYLARAIVTITALGFLLTSAQPEAKITLTSRSKTSIYRTRAIEKSTLHLDDFFLGTDLQWFGNISVGTPPQHLTVIFDTGSQTLEFTSTFCTSQACSGQFKFDPSKSSTFVDGGFEFNVSFQTGVGVDPVIDNNYALDLVNGTDTVSVGGLTVTNTSLFLIANQTEKFSIDPFDGILGMGTTSNSKIGVFGAFIEQGLPSLFSLYLTPKSVGNAEIIFGGIDESKFNGAPIYASLIQPNDGLWLLPPSAIHVNGQTSPFLSSDLQVSIVFDSGTSNIVFPTNITNAIYAKISPDIKPNPNEPGAYGIPCRLISSLSSKIDITFTSQQGKLFNLTIPSSELNVGPFADNPSICQTMINALDLPPSPILGILGGSFLKHYYSIWDVGAQRIGFAPAVW